VNLILKKEKNSSKALIKKCSPSLLAVAYVISRIIFFFKGVRVKYVSKVGKKIESPSIVLCNHGSFIDFAYAGSLIRRNGPNFIVARLYFYKKNLSKLLRKFGCFPKSMFASDLESAKTCLRVLRSGNVLAMMPEARLSTVGRFEDIQPGTYAFLKKMNVPVYTVKISGDYLADPKWGDGLRRGSLIEAELDILFTAEDLAELTPEEIGNRVEERLYYDEFEWLKTRPYVSYRSKTLAEGLQNILIRCPVCGEKYTLSTKGHDVICESCGMKASVDGRYEFPSDFKFKNFAEWYEYQKEEIKNAILTDPDYSLSSNVEFCLPSLDGKTMIRKAGDGVCTLDRQGLLYKGTKGGEEYELSVPIDRIYRLLFGAGENFEIYIGKEIYYFRPEDKRSAVEWYIASSVLVDEYAKIGAIQQ